MDKMVSKKTSRILFLIFLISAGILLLLGHIFFNLQKDEVTRKIYSELQAISSLKEKQIQDWYRERLELSDFIRNDQSLISDLKVFFDTKGKSERKVIKWLAALRRDSNFAEAMFFDPQFQTRFSPEFFHPISSPGLKAMKEAAMNMKVVISDIHRSATDSNAHIDIAIPLLDRETEKNPLVGILFIRIDPLKFLFPLMQNWEGLSKSGETLLARRDGDSVVFLNTLRHVKNVPLEMKYSLKDTSLPAARLIQGKLGFFEGVDYRHVQVLSYLNKIEGTGWFMVTKEDTDEIYAPLRFRAFITGAVVVLLIIIVAVILFLIWKHEQKKYFEERYKLEAERKLLSKHVELLVKHANDIIFMLDENQKIVDANDKALEVYGYTKEEMLKLSVRDIRTPEKIPSIEDTYTKIDLNGGILFETMHQKKDGTIFPVESSMRSIEIDGNRFYQGIVRDISERKSRDIKIQRLNRVYATLSDINQLIVRVKDRKILYRETCKIAVEKGKFRMAWFGLLDGDSHEIKIVAQNGVGLEYLKNIGISLDKNEPEGKGPTGTALREGRYNICNDVENDERMKPWKQKALAFGFKSSAAFPILINRKVVGSVNFYSDEKNFFDKDEISLLDELSKDISFALEYLEEEEKRKKAEEENRKLLRGIEQSPATIVITDIDGRIEYVNPKFTEVTGYTFEEAIGNNPRILKSGEKSPEEYKLMWETIKNGKEWRGEFHNKKKNGELYWEQASISPIKDDQGNITHFIAVKEDITELKRLIEELFAAKDRAEQANRLKSEFLAQMSHEIRSPINVTMNFSDLIKDELGERITPELNEYFEGIQTAGKRLTRTIGLILNASEIQVGLYEPTWTRINLMKDVFESIKSEYDASAKTKGLDFSIKCKASEPNIRGDKYSVCQIFVNLIDNAIKYTKEGKVEISVDRNNSGSLEVTIEDTGIGMSKDFMVRMFEPFIQEERGYSRKYEGNGLGLSLVKRYCDLNNAAISVQSEKGKGTRFAVAFVDERTTS